MGFLKTAIGYVAPVALVCTGVGYVNIAIHEAAQARTEAAAASALKWAEEQASDGAYVAVVLGCYNKHCLTRKPGLVKVLTPRGVEKWQIQHGDPGVVSTVSKGFKLVKCHCTQSECLARGPGLTWIEQKPHRGLTVLEVSK